MTVDTKNMRDLFHFTTGAQADVARQAADELDALRKRLEAAENELYTLRPFAEVARRKLAYLLRDYPGDKETAHWIGVYDSIARPQGGGEGERCR